MRLPGNKDDVSRQSSDSNCITNNKLTTKNKSKKEKEEDAEPLCEWLPW